MLLLALRDNDSISKSFGLNLSSDGRLPNMGWVDARLLELPLRAVKILLQAFTAMMKLNYTIKYLQPFHNKPQNRSNAFYLSLFLG